MGGAIRSKANPNEWQGIVETAHRTPRRYERNPLRPHHILIQGIVRSCGGTFDRVVHEPRVRGVPA
jgi:hypothetical protein